MFFEGFLLIWGIIFAVSTTLLAIFKHETDEAYDSNEPHSGLVDTYKILFKVLRLPSVRSIGLILLTVKVRLSTIDNYRQTVIVFSFL
jgi:MFS transporter, PAT family, solute carrier family 33 (acetyl-CoA transportor), member 1